MIIKIENIIRSKIYNIISIIFLLFVLSFFTLDYFFPININIDYSKVVKSRDNIILSSFLSKDEKWRFYTNINESSEYFKKLIVFKEDRFFYLHFGFNPYSILRAFYNNITSQKTILGASTITMQTARLLEPKQRTYFNKIIEIFRALQLEFHYSKDEILELYLNKIPFGGNIEGIGSAAVLYFGKNPNKLSLSESAILSIIPNSPNILNINKKSQKIEIKKNELLKKYYNSNNINKDIYEDAIQEPVSIERLDAPKTAPQFSFRAIKENPSKSVINTTINYTIQKRAEDIIKNYVSELKNYGINNAAAMIIDNRKNEIVAYIGSNDFDDKKNSGEVDGVLAIRSPGSTLKPLLYALMFDDGSITPKLSILDIPIIGMDYTPENFDGQFNGKVTCEYALSQSLNVPAVNLLNKYGYNNFIDKLAEMNFSTIRKDRKKLGLSLILGGCGVTLEELANLYSLFANNGIYKKASYLNNNNNKSIQIISDAASYMTSDILRKLKRPDFPKFYNDAKNIPIISWKTGTSQGKRDAWAVAYNSSYTIGVWIGNFSGKPNSAISGANTAVPLLFDFFNTISSGEKSNWLVKPESLSTRLVDSETGLLPSEFSKHTISDYYIPNRSISRVTDNIRNFWVSEDEKISYCSDCLPEKGYKTKPYEIIDLELQMYYKSKNINFIQVPPHNPKCLSYNYGKSPIIISPKDKSEYFIEKGDTNGIVLSAKIQSDANKIYWFINDKFFEKINSYNIINWLPNESGHYRVTCTDNKGGTSEIKIKVNIY